MNLSQIYKLANQGDVNAQYGLGTMLHEGKTIPQDFEESLMWLTKAAKQNHHQCQYNVGYMHLDAEGTEQDDEQAFYWFEKAAESGLPEA